MTLRCHPCAAPRHVPSARLHNAARVAAAAAQQLPHDFHAHADTRRRAHQRPRHRQRHRRLDRGRNPQGHRRGAPPKPCVLHRPPYVQAHWAWHAQQAVQTATIYPVALAHKTAGPVQAAMQAVGPRQRAHHGGTAMHSILCDIEDMKRQHPGAPPSHDWLPGPPGPTRARAAWARVTSRRRKYPGNFRVRKYLLELPSRCQLPLLKWP